jgi:hypothetical protein
MLLLHVLVPCPSPSAAGALSITPGMDEDTRARIRREKNRVAARKCRAKKMAFMVELQKTLRELMRKNEEYRLQVCVAGVHFLCLVQDSLLYEPGVAQMRLCTQERGRGVQARLVVTRFVFVCRRGRFQR